MRNESKIEITIPPEPFPRCSLFFNMIEKGKPPISEPSPCDSLKPFFREGRVNPDVAGQEEMIHASMCVRITLGKDYPASPAGRLPHLSRVAAPLDDEEHISLEWMCCPL